jgi:hypothetical protein
MSIGSVGSSFNVIQPIRAARETAASARAAEAATASVDNGASGSKDWLPRTASDLASEKLQSTAIGRLVAAQEEATSRPGVSSHDASKAYSRG